MDVRTPDDVYSISSPCKCHVVEVLGFDPHFVLEQDTLTLHSTGKYPGSGGSDHDMTETLFTGTLNINTNKYSKQLYDNFFVNFNKCP